MQIYKWIPYQEDRPFSLDRTFQILIDCDFCDQRSSGGCLKLLSKFRKDSTRKSCSKSNRQSASRLKYSLYKAWRVTKRFRSQVSMVVSHPSDVSGVDTVFNSISCLHSFQRWQGSRRLMVHASGVPTSSHGNCFGLEEVMDDSPNTVCGVLRPCMMRGVLNNNIWHKKINTIISSSAVYSSSNYQNKRKLTMGL